MKQYPADMADFMDMFPGEDACLEYLSIVRWPDGYKCLHCGNADYWKKARGLFTCRACGYEASVLAGTLFQDTHKPLRLWFQAMWHVVNQKNGVSALGLQKALGLGSYHTAWEWLHKLRRAMVRPGRDRLSGIVEVDETFLGGRRRSGSGHGAEGKPLAFIAAEEAKDNENAIGRIRLSVIENSAGETLAKAVQSALLRARRETSMPSTIPACPSATSVISFAKPARSTAPEPERPRSSSMMATCCAGQPSSLTLEAKAPLVPPVAGEVREGQGPAAWLSSWLDAPVRGIGPRLRRASAIVRT